MGPTTSPLTPLRDPAYPLANGSCLHFGASTVGWFHLHTEESLVREEGAVAPSSRIAELRSIGQRGEQSLRELGERSKTHSLPNPLSI